MNAYPRQTLDDGKQIYFGQAIGEVEALLGVAAIDIPVKIVRPGIDRTIKTPQLTLWFDHGHLLRMQFEHGFQFAHPPTPFAEPWQNFEKIGALQVRPKMMREELIEYIDAWEARAIEMGAEKVDFDDIKEDQFACSFTQETLFGTYFDTFAVSFGPARPSGGGSFWASGWHVFFAVETDLAGGDISLGEMKSMRAFCDEFNTVARKKAD